MKVFRSIVACRCFFVGYERRNRCSSLSRSILCTSLHAPTIGRFTSRDTYPLDTLNPFELNRYVYTANNPMTYVDPSGNASLVGRIGIHIGVAGKAIAWGKVVGYGAAVSLPWIVVLAPVFADLVEALNTDADRVDEKKDDDGQCNNAQYKDVIKCQSPKLTSYVYSSFEKTLDAVAVTFGATKSNLQVHPHRNGDLANDGPCNRHITDLGYTGKHWNIWKSKQQYDKRHKPPKGTNAPPLCAITSCKCCDRNIEAPLSPIVEKFRLVRSHG